MLLHREEGVPKFPQADFPDNWIEAFFCVKKKKPIGEIQGVRLCCATFGPKYKSLNHCAPDYLSSLLSLQTSSYSLCSSTGKSLSVHKTHKLAGDRAFSIAAPLIWNSLPTLTRSSKSVTAFKRALKTHLFDSS